MMNTPPLGPMQGKHWGNTRCVYSHNNTEIWEIAIDRGGFCSEHFHHDKWNRFVVFKGLLKVTIFPEDESGSIDETILGAGGCTDVPPNRWHMFEALGDVEGIEIYWTTLDPSDIVRRTIGGMRDEL